MNRPEKMRFLDSLLYNLKDLNGKTVEYPSGFRCQIDLTDLIKSVEELKNEKEQS